MASIAGMKHLGRVVRELRQERGLTLSALADEVPNYDAGNLSRFERGQQDIPMVKLEAIALLLGVPAHEMMRRAAALEAPELDGPVLLARDVAGTYTVPGGTADIASNANAPYAGPLQGVRRMPLLSDSQAASLGESADALKSAADYVETTEDVGADGFAWRCPDDSMVGDGALSFSPGIVVLFRMLGAHAPGDCVLVRLGPSDVQFCQLTRAAGQWYMSPLNRRYPPRELPADARVLGVAVAAQFKVPRGGG